MIFIENYKIYIFLSYDPFLFIKVIKLKHASEIIVNIISCPIFLIHETMILDQS